MRTIQMTASDSWGAAALPDRKAHLAVPFQVDFDWPRKWRHQIQKRDRSIDRHSTDLPSRDRARSADCATESPTPLRVSDWRRLFAASSLLTWVESCLVTSISLPMAKFPDTHMLALDSLAWCTCESMCVEVVGYLTKETKTRRLTWLVDGRNRPSRTRRDR